MCDCRNCIGMRFALLETKLAIVKAMCLVEIQKCEKTEVDSHHVDIQYRSFEFLDSNSIGPVDSSVQ